MQEFFDMEEIFEKELRIYNEGNEKKIKGTNAMNGE